MSNNLNDISRVYLDQIANIKKTESEGDTNRWTQTEAKVDTGSAAEKATARNKRNTPAGKDYKFDTSVFITRKPGESLDSARTRTRQKAHAAKRGVKEGFSNWRTDLAEVIDTPTTDTKDLKTVDVKKGIKNKVIINPKLTEAIGEIGGQLLSVEEQDIYESEIEDAVEYFYEQGINEEGIELIIEEVGLDDFVEFVIDPSEDLMEERDARRASVRAKKYDVVKKEVDKSDAAKKAAKKVEYAPSYAKKETDVTVYDDDKPAAKKKAPAKKTVVKKAAPKPAPKPVAKKPVVRKATPAKKVQTQKKVVKSVAKVKKTQPAKRPSKSGLASRIGSAVKKGVERHQKAVGKAKEAYKTQRAKGKVPEKRAKEFGKGVKSGVKTAVKFAKDVKKVVSEEELLEKDLNAAERRALPNKDFVFPGKGEGPKGKQRGAYPIPDKKHARNALAMAAAHASPEKQAQVKAAVKKKFPDIEVSEAKVDTGSAEEKATARNKRNTPAGKDYKFDTSVFITRKPGESLDSARTRMRQKKHGEKRGVSESRDKALDIVRQRIIKKHGEGAIYDAKRDKPTEAQKKTAAAERKKRDADKAKAFADRAKKAGYKSTQDYANVVARYGSEDNMKKGRGLGT